MACNSCSGGCGGGDSSASEFDAGTDLTSAVQNIHHPAWWIVAALIILYLFSRK